MEQKGEITKGHKETSGVVNMLITLIMVMFSWICLYIYTTSKIYVKTHQIVVFKYVQFIVCNDSSIKL